MGSVGYLTLKDTEPEDFFKVFNLYFTRTVNENKPKITVIEQSLNTIYQKLASLSDLAVKDLEPLLLKIEKELKGREIEDLKRISEYKDVKDGKIIVHGENLASTLYHAIRLTLEQHYETLGFKNYEDVLTKHENGFVYFDYYKVVKIYPSYKNFTDYQDWLEKFLKESPEGGFQTLYGLYTGFQNADKETIEFFVRKQAIKGFTLLGVYLDSNLDLKDLRKPFIVNKQQNEKKPVDTTALSDKPVYKWIEFCEVYLEPNNGLIRYKDITERFDVGRQYFKFIRLLFDRKTAVGYYELAQEIGVKSAQDVHTEDRENIAFSDSVRRAKSDFVASLRSSKFPADTKRYIENLIKNNEGESYFLECPEDKNH